MRLSPSVFWVTIQYNLADFKATVDKKHKQYQQALSTGTKEIAAAKKFNAEYEKMPKQ